MFRSVLLKCSLRVAHYPSSSHGRTGPGRRLCPSPESPLLGRGQGCKSSLSCASGFLRYAPSFESSWFSSLFLTPLYCGSVRVYSRSEKQWRIWAGSNNFFVAHAPGVLIIAHEGGRHCCCSRRKVMANKKSPLSSSFSESSALQEKILRLEVGSGQSGQP